MGSYYQGKMTLLASTASVSGNCSPRAPLREYLGRGVIWWLAMLAILPGLPGAWRGNPAVYEILGWVLAVLVIGRKILLWGRLSALRPGVVFGIVFFSWLALWSQWTSSAPAHRVWIALLFFLAGSALTFRELRQLPRALYWTGWAVFLLAMVDYMGWLPSGMAKNWRETTFVFLGHTRLSGTFFHPNLFAYFLLIQWVAGFCLLRPRQMGQKSLLPLYLFSLCTLGALALTLSRSILLGFFLLGVLTFIVPRGRKQMLSAPGKRYIFYGFSSLILVSLLFSGAWQSRLIQLFDMAHQANDTVHTISASPPPKLSPGKSALPDLERMGRLEIWMQGLRLWKQSPEFGWGIGGFHKHGRGHLHSHNILLELLLSGGLFAMVALIAALVWMLRDASRIRWWHVVILLPILTGLFDCFLFFNFPLLLMALLFGAAAPGRHLTPSPLESSEPAVSGIPALHHAGVFLAGVVFLVFALAIGHRVFSPPADFYCYYATTQWVNHTFQSPYMVWPSAFEIPANHPMAVWAFREHGLVPVRYFYPPAALLLFTPISLISKAPWASLTWLAMQMLLIIMLVWGALRLRHIPARYHWLALLAVICHAPVIACLVIGQVSLLLGVMALWIWLLHRDGKSLLAGLFLAIAVILKVFPILWLGMLFIKPRGWKVFLLGFAIGVLVQVSLSLGVYGTDLWRAYYTWVLNPLNTYSPGPSISLKGLADYYSILDKDLFVRIGIGLLGFLFWIGWRVQQWRDPDPDIGVLGVVALSVLASPVAWYHYGSLITGFLAGFLLTVIRSGMQPLAFSALAIHLLTGLEFTGHTIPQSSHRAALGLLAATLLPFILLQFDPPETTLFRWLQKEWFLGRNYLKPLRSLCFSIISPRERKT